MQSQDTNTYWGRNTAQVKGASIYYAGNILQYFNMLDESILETNCIVHGAAIAENCRGLNQLVVGHRDLRKYQRDISHIFKLRTEGGKKKKTEILVEFSIFRHGNVTSGETYWWTNVTVYGMRDATLPYNKQGMKHSGALKPVCQGHARAECLAYTRRFARRTTTDFIGFVKAELNCSHQGYCVVRISITEGLGECV